MSNSADIGFKIIREEWNVYKIENGTILKMRTPLTSLKHVEEGKTMFVYGNLTFTDPVDEDRGKPSANQKIGKKDVIGPVNFEAVKEMSNIYETDGKFIVIVVPRITNLVSTKKFDVGGARMYQMSTIASVSVVPFPERGESTNAATGSFQSSSKA